MFYAVGLTVEGIATHLTEALKGRDKTVDQTRIEQCNYGHALILILLLSEHPRGKN